MIFKKKKKTCKRDESYITNELKIGGDRRYRKGERKSRMGFDLIEGRKRK